MRVIFNADDFGLTKGITDGIIQSFTDGVVGATTLMMNGRAVDYAVRLAKQHPALKVGIHLVLSYGKPLNAGVGDLVNADGTFKFQSQFDANNAPNVAQVEKEWRTQIEAFLATGLPLHHIDSHHHVHQWEVLQDVVLTLAKEYDVPVRYVDSLKAHPEILLTDYMWDGFYADGVTADIFNQLKELEVESVEVMTHPAIVDEELKAVSSYVEKRKEELDILTSLEVPEWANI